YYFFAKKTDQKRGFFFAEFDSLRPFSYPETDVFLLCFNVMLPSTLRSITSHWLPEISKSAPHTPIILVGTQCDLRSNVSLARMFADELRTEYVECSALTQYNLKQVFDAAILVALKGKFLSSNPEATHKERKKSKFRDGLRRFVSFTKRLV
ncbi:unnamed protein product, partial [Enterobius vermicularis]|uniref:Ras homolog family member U n=1 Tax=Enterobius vermicularis TaxID=51028 RepID=A0A0N4VLM5_ENTVE